MGRGQLLAAGMVLVVAAGLRVGGLCQDFWLDEIWSLELSKLVSGPLAIIELAYDNNHYLNTLTMYWLGPQQPWYVYRLPSLVAGVGTVALGWLAGREYGRLEAILAELLVGLCYLLIHYSSEARGYSSAIFFALCCFHLLQKQSVSVCAGRSVLFAVCACLGFLSHLTFLFPYAGFVVWSALALRRTSATGRGWLGAFVAHHALPMVMVAWLYVVNLRHMGLGGGDARPLGSVLAETLGWTLGTSANELAIFVTILFVAAALVVELGPGTTRPREEALFFLATIFAAPALLLWFSREDVYPRYFLLVVPFVLIVVARFLARCLRSDWLPRLVAAGFLVTFCVGNLRATIDFLTIGRGDYQGAVRHLLEQTPGEEVTVTGDYPFRNKMVLAYYTERAATRKQVAYLEPESWTRDRPLWLLRIHRHWETLPPAEILLRNGMRYTLGGTFPYAGASGWEWLVYRGR